LNNLSEEAGFILSRLLLFLNKKSGDVKTHCGGTMPQPTFFNVFCRHRRSEQRFLKRVARRLTI
jgi:hypothetical protein